jgi:hypothetical protein
VVSLPDHISARSDLLSILNTEAFMKSRAQAHAIDTINRQNNRKHMQQRMNGRAGAIPIDRDGSLSRSDVWLQPVVHFRGFISVVSRETH